MQILPLILIGVFIFIVLLGLAIVNFSVEEAYRVLKKYEYNSGSTINSLLLINLVAKYELNKIINVNLFDGEYIDNYNYNKQLITLSRKNSNSTSFSALTVTAHELGHAIQFNKNPKMFKKFNNHFLISNFVSNLFIPLIVIGLILMLIDNMFIFGIILMGLSLICFIISLLFKLATMKIEKEASEIALYVLKEYAEFDDNMLKISKIILKSSYNTYYADFLRSLLKWTMLTTK